MSRLFHLVAMGLFLLLLPLGCPRPDPMPELDAGGPPDAGEPDAGPRWTLRQGPFSEVSLVIAGSQRFVALGNQGEVLTSFDGEQWSLPRKVADGAMVAGIPVGDGFVAVGGHFQSFGPTQILSTPNAMDWTPNGAPVRGILSGAASSGDLHVAVGSYRCHSILCRTVGGLIISEDGVRWTARLNEWSSGPLTGVAWGNGVFVAAGPPATLTSVDGINWAGGPPPFGAGFIELAFGAGRFVALGDTLVATSSDGLTWQRQADAPTALRALRWQGDVFSALDASGRTLWTSPDGASWTATELPGRARFNSVARRGARWIAGGTALATRVDGEPWRIATTDTDGWVRVVHGGGTFVARGEQGQLLSSADGHAWVLRHWADQGLTGLVYGNSRFVAVGRGGSVLTSDDGISWTPRESGTTHDFSGVNFLEDRFFAFHRGGMLVSTDGVTWAPLAGTHFPAAFGQGVFLTAAPAPFVTGGWEFFTAPDAVTWTSRHISTATGTPLAIFGNGLFLVVQNDGLARLSADGTTWTQHTIEPRLQFHLLRFARGRFVALAKAEATGRRVLATSADGVHWSVEETGFEHIPLGALADDGVTLVVTGAGGTILTRQ